MIISCQIVKWYGYFKKCYKVFQRVIDQKRRLLLVVTVTTLNPQVSTVKFLQPHYLHPHYLLPPARLLFPLSFLITVNSLFWSGASILGVTFDFVEELRPLRYVPRYANRTGISVFFRPYRYVFGIYIPVRTPIFKWRAGYQIRTRPHSLLWLSFLRSKTATSVKTPALGGLTQAFIRLRVI